MQTICTIKQKKVAELSEAPIFIGKNINYLCLVNNLSKTDLAKNLNINRNQISNYVNGRNNPPITMIVKIAAFFNIELNELVLKDLSQTGVAGSAEPNVSYDKNIQGEGKEYSKEDIEELMRYKDLLIDMVKEKKEADKGK